MLAWVSVLRLGVDGIPDTRNAWIDNNGNGVFDSADQLDYNKITYFNSADWALYFTYAQRSASGLLYGVNVKLIRRTSRINRPRGLDSTSAPFIAHGQISFWE